MVAIAIAAVCRCVFLLEYIHRSGLVLQSPHTKQFMEEV